MGQHSKELNVNRVNVWHVNCRVVVEMNIVGVLSHVCMIFISDRIIKKILKKHEHFCDAC